MQDTCHSFEKGSDVLVGRQTLEISARLAASLALVLCFAFPSITLAETGSEARTIAVVSFLRDEVRGQWSDGGTIKYIAVTKVDWNPGGQIADDASRLTSARAVRLISVTPSPEAVAGLKPTTPQGFARAVAERLRKRGELQGAEFVLVVTPNAIDYLGRQYSAFMNFLSAGIVGVAAGEQMKAKTHYPAFTLGLRTELAEVMNGKSQCMIGLNAVLIDVETLYVRGQTVGVVGRAEVPKTVWHPKSGFSGDGLTVARQRCLEALKMGTRLAMRGVRLKQLPAKQAKQRPGSVGPSGPVPRCRDVGGYEAYMKRTGKVCRID
jgi:hypothetical protein